MINIFDPRANKIILKQQITQAFQSSKFEWIDNNLFVTTSWTKTGAKFFKIMGYKKSKI